MSVEPRGQDQRGRLGRLAERIGERVGPDALIAQVDLDALLARVDLDALLARVDLDAALQRVDVDAILARVDLDAILARVDPDALLARVDVDALLDRVDVDRLLARVDVNGLLDRVEPDRLLDRVDVDRMMGRVDVDALLAGVDLEAVVRRSGVPEIVQESTSRMAGSALDLARRQLVGVDVLLDRVLDRVLRRGPGDRPQAPPLLAQADQADAGTRRTSVTGHYALPVTRAVASGIDAGLVLALFTVATAGLGWLARVFLGLDADLDTGRWGAIVASGLFAAWAFTYVFASVAIAGQTPGKAIVGIRVVSADGGAPGARQALVRTLVTPISALVLGLGLLMVLVHPRHRALHDLAGGTAVVYDFGERPAELPAPLSAYLARQ